MTSWTLQGTAQLSPERWPELVTDLAGWHAAWADLDGFHLTDALPDELPLTSHLWAWTGNGWLRVRADGDSWWASALFRGALTPSALWRAEPEVVDVVTADRIRSWALSDGRVAQMRLTPGTTVPEEMIQLVPVRAQAAVYIGSVVSFTEPPPP